MQLTREVAQNARPPCKTWLRARLLHFATKEHFGICALSPKELTGGPVNGARRQLRNPEAVMDLALANWARIFNCYNSTWHFPSIRWNQVETGELFGLTCLLHRYAQIGAIQI
mmetsp:Transcript_41775/g.103070  ORF Transcript_41775/g.103070 Transcript_41775/m.103070 type:complete len:113 (-) Transcript_41775:751-1089(-)